jgi:hypothetical protein
MKDDPAAMGENPGKNLIDQEMLEGAQWDTHMRPDGDRKSVSGDADRRDPGSLKPVATPVPGVRERPGAVGGTPVMVPPSVLEIERGGGFSPQETFGEAGRNRWKLGKREVAFDDEIGEAVEHA